MKEGFKVVEELSIPSDFDSMHEVENLIDKVCTNYGVGDNYGNILIAVTEAVNNAILHGNVRDKDLLVKVGVWDETSSFCFSINDAGQGFDFANLPDPTAPENIEKENGRGIFLMKNLADDVVFEDYGKCVNIYFKK
jgi:serine/threonine-protein kinase RsbW